MHARDELTQQAVNAGVRLQIVASQLVDGSRGQAQTAKCVSGHLVNCRDAPSVVAWHPESLSAEHTHPPDGVMRQRFLLQNLGRGPGGQLFDEWEPTLGRQASSASICSGSAHVEPEASASFDSACVSKQRRPSLHTRCV